MSELKKKNTENMEKERYWKRESIKGQGVHQDRRKKQECKGKINKDTNEKVRKGRLIKI